MSRTAPIEFTVSAVDSDVVKTADARRRIGLGSSEESGTQARGRRSDRTAPDGAAPIHFSPTLGWRRPLCQAAFPVVWSDPTLPSLTTSTRPIPRRPGSTRDRAMDTITRSSKGARERRMEPGVRCDMSGTQEPTRSLVYQRPLSRTSVPRSGPMRHPADCTEHTRVPGEANPIIAETDASLGPRCLRNDLAVSVSAYARAAGPLGPGRIAPEAQRRA